MRLPEARFRHLAAAGLVALIGALPLMAAEPEAATTDLAQRVEQRYEVRDLHDSILLRPHDEDSAVRSIEITDDDEVLVNGKEFTSRELEAFLGADGDLIRQLADLDRRERRKALGLWSEPSEEPGQREKIDIQVPVPPRPPRVHVRVSGDDRVSVGHSIQLEEGEYAHDVVCVMCSVDILGETSGDAVAVLGSVHVGGRVGGNAVSILGSVEVEDGAEVNGDGVSVGGSLETHGTGRIHGQNTQVGVGSPWRHGWTPGWSGRSWSLFSDTSRLIAAMLRAGFLALLAVLAVLAARPSVEMTARRVANEPWKAVFAGLLAQLLFLPVLVLTVVILAVSVVGIPLLVLVPFALLALLVGMFIGFVGVARNVGTWAEQRFGWTASSVALSVVVGVVLIQVTSLLGRLVSIPGGWFGAFGLALVGLGFFVKYVAWTAGFGAMTLTVLSGEWRRSGRAAAAVPPVPPPDDLPGLPPADDEPFDEAAPSDEREPDSV